MKAYKCDICEIAITDPYTAKMKEFYLACDFEFEGIYPKKAKRKQKLHLCWNCFEGLKGIFAKRSTEPAPFEPFGKTEQLKNTADVVEVVRCKDCKHCDKGVCYHPTVKYVSHDKNHFCGYGEREQI